jgi:outer membrane protein
MSIAKKTVALSLFSTLLLSTAVVAADAPAKDGAEAPAVNSSAEFNPWMLRLRAIDINPDSESTLSSAGSANVESNYVPELDITYFLTKNVAAELILATSEHKVNALNSTDLGSAWVLPPTLTLQYHFMPESTIRPYVGAGVNYTWFYNVDKGPGLARVQYQDGFGYALQAGVDLMKDEHWGLNIDVKRIFLSTDVAVNNGAINGDVNLDPWVLGVGVTYKF